VEAHTLFSAPTEEEKRPRLLLFFFFSFLLSPHHVARDQSALADDCSKDQPVVAGGIKSGVERSGTPGIVGVKGRAREAWRQHKARVERSGTPESLA